MHQKTMVLQVTSPTAVMEGRMVFLTLRCGEFGSASKLYEVLPDFRGFHANDAKLAVRVKNKPLGLMVEAEFEKLVSR